MSKNSLGKTVHIVPMGFEYDRAVAPFKNRKVDKVILVLDEEYKDPTIIQDQKKRKMYEKQKNYTDKTKEFLREKGVSVCEEYTKPFELDILIKDLSSIIKREKTAGNHVYINMSSSGRFVSVAAAIAGMAHNIVVYYVNAEGYSEEEDEIKEHGVSICSREEPDVRVIGNFQLKIPRDEYGMILELLYVNKYEWNKPWTSLNEIANMLHRFFTEDYLWDPEQIPKFVGRPPNMRHLDKYNYDKSDEDKKKEAEIKANYRNLQSQFIMKFQKTVAKDMVDEKYIERKPDEPKNVYYQITQSGEYALFLYGITGKISSYMN